MCRFFVFVLTLALLAGAGLTAKPVQANGPVIHLVQTGDSLFSIAAHYGVSVEALAMTNGLGWNTWLYPGQELIIPYQQVGGTHQFNTPPAQPFDQPRAINSSWTTPPSNSPTDQSYGWTQPSPPIYTSHPFTSPPVLFQNGADAQPYRARPFYQPAFPAGPFSPQMPSSSLPTAAERWIDVDLTQQTVTAYEGQLPVFGARASTGIWKYPTIAGTFQIYVKYEKTQMTGGSGEDYYNLPDVPYVMYFHGGYGLHGTYWHNNFGTPMSHGCVNLSIPDAGWLFNWASIGTRVVTHY